MKLDPHEINDLLLRFDEKVSEARAKYYAYLRNNVRIGDYFNVTFTFSMNRGESSLMELRGNLDK